MHAPNDNLTPSAGAVVELVRGMHADVLFVQEPTDDAAARLGRAG